MSDLIETKSAAVRKLLSSLPSRDRMRVLVDCLRMEMETPLIMPSVEPESTPEEPCTGLGCRCFRCMGVAPRYRYQCAECRCAYYMKKDAHRCCDGDAFTYMR